MLNGIKYDLQSKALITPWVGLRKINVSYWCWEDMSPFTNSTLQWLPGEPSDAGFCGYLAEPAFNGLKAATCVNSVNGSLCERPSEKDAHIHTALTRIFFSDEQFSRMYMQFLLYYIILYYAYWHQLLNLLLPIIEKNNYFCLGICQSPFVLFLVPLLHSLSVLSANHSVKQCRTPCALRSSCSECTSGSSECMWCSNMRQCVDSNAYVASFPYGQCMEWYTMNSCPRTSALSFSGFMPVSLCLVFSL